KLMRLSAVKGSAIHPSAKVCSASHVLNSSIDRYSYVGNDCTIIEAEIGSFCSIADNVIIGGASHPVSWVSTSPVFIKGRNVLNFNFSSFEYQATEKTYIGSDVWIGNNALIKSGIHIGHGAVIGMGA